MFYLDSTFKSIFHSKWNIYKAEIFDIREAYLEYNMA